MMPPATPSRRSSSPSRELPHPTSRTYTHANRALLFTTDAARQDWGQKEEEEGEGKGTHREGRGEERREEVAEVGEVLEPLVVLLLPEPRVPASGGRTARPRPSIVASESVRLLAGQEGRRVKQRREGERTSKRGRGRRRRLTGRRRRRRRPSPAAACAGGKGMRCWGWGRSWGSVEPYGGAASPSDQ